MAFSIGRAPDSSAGIYTHQAVDPTSTTMDLPVWLTATAETGYTHTKRQDSSTEYGHYRFTPSSGVAVGGAIALATSSFRPQVNLDMEIGLRQWRCNGNVSSYDISLFIANVGATGAVGSPAIGVWWEYRAATGKAFIRWTTGTAVYSELEVPDLNISLHPANSSDLSLRWNPLAKRAWVCSEGKPRRVFELAGHNGDSSSGLTVRAGMRSVYQGPAAGALSTDTQEWRGFYWKRP